MSVNEYKKIKDKYNIKKNDEKLMFFSKNFLSFSKNGEVAESFANISNEPQEEEPSLGNYLFIL